MRAQLSRKTVGLLRTILEQMTPQDWTNALFDFGIEREALDLMRIRGFRWSDILPDLHAERFGNNNSYFSNSLPGPAQSSQSTNDITWNFEKEEGRFAFLAMQTVPGVVSEPLIIGFQAHGKNNLEDPIIHFSGFIRSDTTNETFPIFLARDNRFLRPEETLGIPRKAEFDLHATFPSNHPERYSGEGMNASAFLRQYPELTFVFEYEGKKYTKHFDKKDIWAAVENFRKESLGY